MLSTAIGVQFDVNDLDANYEILGSSDNYSFQYNFGKGSSLVDFEGDTAQKTISLKGNYGEFSVRIFAVSDIGIRSAFIEDKISISPPEFDDTFTFSNIEITNLPQDSNIGSVIEIEPSLESGNLLAVDSEYIGRNLEIEWRLTPPVGHAKEGQSLGNELLSDKLLRDFSLQIRNTENGNIISTSQLNNSVALQQSLNTSSVSDMMGAYTGFSFAISNDTLTELNLDRTLALEVVSNDAFGRQATGVITGTNFLPEISNLIYNLRGAEMSFSWFSLDTDFDGVAVSSLAIPGEIEIYDEYNLQNSIDYYTSLSIASSWQKHNNYRLADKVLYDNEVYSCIQSYSFSSNPNITPDDSSYWNGLGPPVDFQSISEDKFLETVKYDQTWGYNYYYSFLPSDGYGTGILYNLTETGLAQGGSLASFKSDVKIDNLNFIEREDDLIFRWNVTDQDNNLVDLNQYKFLVGSSDKPSILGISGSLFDSDSKVFLTGITEGLNSRTSITEGGIQTIVENLPGSKVFEAFEYTREINNEIYKVGGFPEYSAFSFSGQYVNGDNVTFGRSLYTATSSVDAYTLPQYGEWSPGSDYVFRSSPKYSDGFVYNGGVYHLVGFSDGEVVGPSSTDVLGLFNESTNYNIGDLVISPVGRSVIYKASSAYEVGDIVLFQGSLYKSLLAQSSSQNNSPGSSLEYWSPVGAFSDVDCFVFKALAQVPAIGEIIPNTGFNHWEAQTPETSNKFNLHAEAYDFDILNWSKNINFSSENLVIYEDDIWSGLASSGPNTNVGFKIPSTTNSTFWTNVQNGSLDFSTSHSSGDNVYSNGAVYKCLQDNPNGAPLEAVKDYSSEINSSYSGSDWSPYWELNTGYDNIIFQHEGIPESGKRSVGLELGLLDPLGRLLNSRTIIGNNPEPSISPQGFQVDSLSNVTQVHFNFNYVFGSREQTTKVQLYRSEFPNFSILDSEGLPGSGASSFVSEIVGPGDSTFGKNITSITDSPPIPNVTGLGDQITGYYYKILPFDAFGSGDLFNVTDNQGDLERVLVYPHGYNNQNKNGYMGPVFSTTEDAIPGPVIDFGGDTAFKNYFLNWKLPGSQFDLDNNIVSTSPNDISHYELWKSEDAYLYLGTENVTLSEENNLTGYRRITGDLTSLGPIPSEINDPALGITNATNVLNVSAISPSIQVTHNGEPNDKAFFWVRAVDHAGNKGPFTGKADLHLEPSSDVLGLDLILGQALTTDVSDFEKNITQTFPNTLALVPNDPFASNQPFAGEIQWDRHFLYSNGVGHVIGGGDTDQIYSGPNTPKYIWWKESDSRPLTADEKIELGLAQPGEKVISLRQAFVESSQSISNLTFSINSSYDLGGLSTFNNHYVRFKNGALQGQERKVLSYQVISSFGKITLDRPFNSSPVSGDEVEILEKIPLTSSISNPLRDVYYTGQYRVSDYHPAGEGQTNDPQGFVGGDPDSFKPKLLDDGDFIIARNAGGIATPMWHAFANATIGTAHIEEAAITNAKIHNLTADKIRSAKILSQDIQVGGDQESGQIRSSDFGTPVGRGFDGVNYDGAGFAISGNGSFVFKGQDTAFKKGGKLFYENGELNIHGNIRQRDGSELTVLNISSEPSTFDYDETRDGRSVSSDNSQFLNLTAHFNNSSITAGGVRFKMTDPAGNEIFGYGDYLNYSNGNSMSGFSYDTANFDSDNKIATATFECGDRYGNPSSPGFDTIIHPTLSDSPDYLSVNIFVSGLGTSTEDLVTISMLSQGSVGPTGKSPVYRGVWTDYKTRGNNSTDPVIYLGIDEDVNGAESLRGDLVYFDTTINPAGGNGNYYIALQKNGPTTTAGIQAPSLNSQYWDVFGAQFESVATSLLLAKDAVITKSLVMGASDSSNPEAGTNGKIISSDWADTSRAFGGSYSAAGYMLSVDASNTVEFDVGGPGKNYSTNPNDLSYIRYSSDDKKIEIFGSFVNNSSRDSVTFGALSNPNDDQAHFIGGGYNNNIEDITANTLGSLGSSIVGGAYNNITGMFSFIGNGFDNNLGDDYSAIVAGYRNNMSNTQGSRQGANIIGAGTQNEIDGGTNQSVIAGRNNVIEYNPPTQDFGTYINNQFSAKERKVVLDPEFSILSPNFLGDYLGSQSLNIVGTGAISAGNATYRCDNSWLGNFVEIPQKSFRGDIPPSSIGWSAVEGLFGVSVNSSDYLANLLIFPRFYQTPAALWVYVAEFTLDPIGGWIYISSVYQNADGIWVYSSNLGWIFIFSSGVAVGEYYVSTTSTFSSLP